MMRKGKPLGMLNWKTDRFYLMGSVDRETFDQFRKKIEHVPGTYLDNTKAW